MSREPTTWVGQPNLGGEKKRKNLHTDFLYLTELELNDIRTEMFYREF